MERTHTQADTVTEKELHKNKQTRKAGLLILRFAETKKAKTVEQNVFRGCCCSHWVIAVHVPDTPDLFSLSLLTMPVARSRTSVLVMLPWHRQQNICVFSCRAAT